MSENTCIQPRANVSVPPVNTELKNGISGKRVWYAPIGPAYSLLIARSMDTVAQRGAPSGQTDGGSSAMARRLGAARDRCRA